MKAFVILFLSMLLACSGSNDDNAKAPPDAPTYTLVFMDKSVSVNIDRAFVNQKYQQAINDIVEQTVHRKGDKLEVYFIHENTAKARALTLTSRSEMDDMTQASATDREAANTSFELALQREKGLFKQQLRTKLTEQNSDQSNQATDIWASVQVISRVIETGATIRVYYLSDMVESMKGQGRRDFGKQPPGNQAQAEAWAKADAEQFKRHPIGNIDITMILPFEPTSPVKENNPVITQYWQEIFKILGASKVDEL